VHYTRDGQGPPLVFAHGTAADGEQWAAPAAALAGRHTVICPDLSGSGRTTDAGEALTVDALAGQVIAVIAAADATGALVIGHSMGAVVAATVAALPHARQARVLAGHGAPAEAMPELLGQIVAFADAVPAVVSSGSGKCRAVLDA